MVRLDAAQGIEEGALIGTFEASAQPKDPELALPGRKPQHHSGTPRRLERFRSDGMTHILDHI